MDIQSITVRFVSFILKYPIAIHWTIVHQNIFKIQMHVHIGTMIVHVYKILTKNIC